MDIFSNPQTLIAYAVALAAMASIIYVGFQLVPNDNLGKRMKGMALERDRIRVRERERLHRTNRRSAVRTDTSEGFVKNVVDRFSLAKYFGKDGIQTQLAMAGYRGQKPYMLYLFFSLLMPIAMFFVGLLYVFVIWRPDVGPLLKLVLCIGVAFIGLKLPGIYLKNKMTKRQTSIRRAFPDAMDLLLICVESGMSIEAAFRKVSEEIGSQSLELAEELTLTTAEMSYLQDRRTAYDNLGQRTGIEIVKAVASSLIQAEKYGTPIGQALRVLAQESRDMRMMEAEKKAAGLPPKLTVPMIIFFLPVLFVIIMSPAVMQIMAL